jgi:hypothetical protein
MIVEWQRSVSMIELIRRLLILLFLLGLGNISLLSQAAKPAAKPTQNVVQVTVNIRPLTGAPGPKPNNGSNTPKKGAIDQHNSTFQGVSIEETVTIQDANGRKQVDKRKTVLAK